MENVTPEFFQINITYLTRMFLSMNEFSLIIFLHEKKFNLSQRNWIHGCQRPVKSIDESIQFFLLVGKKKLWYGYEESTYERKFLLDKDLQIFPDVRNMILHLVSLPFASNGVGIGLWNVHRMNLSEWQATQPSKSEFLFSHPKFQEHCKICKFLVKVLPFSQLVTVNKDVLLCFK